MNAPRIIPGIRVACTLGVTFPAMAFRPDAPDSARELIPSTVVIGGVVRDGGGLVDGLRGLARRPRLQPHIDAAFKNNPQLTQARVGMLAFAGSAGMDPWTAARTLAGREIAFGVAPRADGEAAVLVAILPDDVEALGRLVTGAQGLLALRGVKPESREIDGATLTIVAPNFMYAQIGGALVLGNDLELLTTSIKGGPTLDDADWFAHDRARGDAFVAIDMARARVLAGADGLPEKSNNPLGGLVLGGWLERLRHADSAGVWLNASETGLEFGGAVESISAWPATHRGFESAFDGVFEIDFSGVRGYLGRITMARDWADLFSQREAILDEAAVGQLVAFSNTLTTLLGGLDFMDDVLPRIRGPIEFIIGDQEFDTLGVMPTPKLPAVAIVAPLNLPTGDPMRKRLMSGGLAALSVVGLEQAQKGQPTLTMEVEEHRGHRIIYAAYSPANAGASMELGAGGGGMAGAGGARYNAAPTMTIIEDRLVIATSVSLTRSIADAILDDGRTPADGAERQPIPEDRMSLLAGPVIELLKLNREEMVLSRMLEKDSTRADAEKAIDSFMAILGFLDSMEASISPDGREFSGRISVKELPR